MKRFTLIGLYTSLIATATLGGGCRRTTVRFEQRYEPVVHERVYVESHVCTHNCHGHYWDGHRAVEIVGGHHHGPGCGHHWDGVHWTLIVEPTIRVERGRHRGEPAHGNRHPPVHVEKHREGSRPAYLSKKGPARKSGRGHAHDADCGCVYDGRHDRWVKVKAQGHRHGPNCGHVHVSGRWTLRH